MNPPHPCVEIVRLDPVRAEVLFSWDQATLPGGAEIRGRLVGPRSDKASTVEVSYQMQPVANRPGVLCVVIPEPSLWTPEGQFIYEAIFEWWQDETCIGRTKVPVGLKTAPK